MLNTLIQSNKKQICNILIKEKGIQKLMFATVVYALVTDSFVEYIIQQVKSGCYNNAITLFTESPKEAAVIAMQGKAISKLLIELNIDASLAHSYTDFILNETISSIKREIENTPNFLANTILIPYSNSAPLSETI